jgi:ubiquinone/menaquinone biosynthesis C-methylase UbiE
MALAGALLAATLPAIAQETASRARSGEQRREQWQKVDEIFGAMALRPGDVVADVGAGDGFFTARLSKAVGERGHVRAVDVSAEALRNLRARVANERLSNVNVIEGAADDPKLAAGTLDAALIVNAYHEMTAYKDMLAKLKAALKPDGRLVIVEPISSSRRDRTRDEQTRQHEISVDYVTQEARDAGFTRVRLVDPFTSRAEGGDEEWLLVLTPGKPRAVAERALSSQNDDWKAPALRIGVEEFKRLLASGHVLVLDVRDHQSYEKGHLPGAILMTSEELSTPEGFAKVKAETRPIVTYCS